MLPMYILLLQMYGMQSSLPVLIVASYHDAVYYKHASRPAKHLSQNLQNQHAAPTGSLLLQDQVANKVLLTKGALEAAIDHIRGAVMIAFPQGLPEWDLVRQALEGTEELAGTSVSIPPMSAAHACTMLCILSSCSAQ